MGQHTRRQASYLQNDPRNSKCRSRKTTPIPKQFRESHPPFSFLWDGYDYEYMSQAGIFFLAQRPGHKRSARPDQWGLRDFPEFPRFSYSPKKSTLSIDTVTIIS
jgi:hypothetical protein